MKRELHFPTPIYMFDIKDKSLNTQLERDIITWMNQDQGVSRTNVKGWHSTTDMHTKPEFARLVNALHEAQNKIYIEEHLDSEPFLGNMWANVNPPGGYNRAHLHPNCVWSGVYYIKTPEKCGALRLKDPRTGAEMISPKLRERYSNVDLQRHAMGVKQLTFPNENNHFHPVLTQVLIQNHKWVLVQENNQ